MSSDSATDSSGSAHTPNAHGLRIKRFALATLRFSGGFATSCLWLWAVGALYFLTFLPAPLRVLLSLSLFVAPSIARHRGVDRRRVRQAVLVTIAVVALAFSFVRPSNDRDWAQDQRILPSATVAEDQLAIDNIRHVELKDGAFHRVWYFRDVYRLSKLKRIWFGVEYFTKLRSMAHTFLTFEFEGGQDDDFLTFSIEIRRQVGESFGPISGSFRQFEIMYVVSHEREMIENRLSTSEDRFYLYPMRATPEAQRELLLHMVARMNQLTTRPEFYNSLTNNCTNNLVRHMNHVARKKLSPYNPRVVFPGFSDAVAYRMDLIDTELSFDEARRHFRIDLKGRDLVGQANFSQAIRDLAR